MNRFTLTIFISLFLAGSSLWSQVPPGINYQALALGSDGAPLRSETVDLRLTLLSDLAQETVIWSEQHTGVVTTTSGLFSVVFGQGVRQSSSAVTLFSDIDWGVEEIFLRTEVRHNSVWYDMGASRLWSVPYALAAGGITGSLRSLSVQEGENTSEEALFEVRNKRGEVVFAVYSEGVRVNVGTGDSKASKSGFAIGSFDRTKGGVNDLMTVSSDSVRIFIDDPSKASKGGFAIGSFDRTKGITDEFLRVSRDSVRIYIDSDESKASKGGFAIGSFDRTKDASTEVFIRLTPENYFIGHQAGKSITSGDFNSFIGFEAGRYNTSGRFNAFMGYRSGYSNTTGQSNLFLGYWSGYSNSVGSFNTFVGYRAGAFNTTGGENTYLGSYTGSNNTTGSLNSFVGYYTGFQNTTGIGNSFFGNYAGYANTDGYSNVFLGNKSGYNNVGGYSNVYIGDSTGYKNTYGGNNVYIGNKAGYNADNDWSNVFIGNQSGYSTTISSNNVFVGNSAGRLTTWGSQNVYIGDVAGERNSTGSQNVAIGVAAGRNSSANNNVFVGYGAGIANTTGGFNLFSGTQAGWNNTTGGNNIFMGSQAGYWNSSGSGNVFVGRQAGFNETGSNRLYIANNSSSVLIYGQFDNQRVAINHAAPTRTLDIDGDIRVRGLPSGSGTALIATSLGIIATQSSDIRLKRDIVPLKLNMEAFLKLTAYSFVWNDEDNGGSDIGFIAQEVEKLFPELVFRNPTDGYLGVNYHLVVPVLVEAIKEQQTQIELQQKAIEELQETLRTLISLIESQGIVQINNR